MPKLTKNQERFVRNIAKTKGVSALPMFLHTATVISDSLIKLYADEIDKFGWPRCAVCKGTLRKGSVVDSQYPYFNEGNHHLGCRLG